MPTTTAAAPTIETAGSDGALRGLDRMSGALTSVLLIVGMSVAACGAAGTAAHDRPSRDSGAAPFASLRPARPPAGWMVARQPGGIPLAYPPSWRQIQAHPGAVSAARVDPELGPDHRVLNASPRQGDVTLQNWARFRPAYNADVSSTHVQPSPSGRTVTSAPACA
jgi:hypothetical protein